MLRKKTLLALCLIFKITLVLTESTWSPATSLNIQEELFAYPCTRLVDKDGPIGCSSSRTGDEGLLWPIFTQEDLDDFIRNVPSRRTVPVVASTLFTQPNIEMILATKKVAGILVGYGDGPSTGLSPVSKFPQQKYGLHKDSTYDWNPFGDDWSFKAYSIPIFALQKGNPNSTAVLERAQKNKENKGKYPQWSVTLNSWMHSANDADTCMRRGQCEPLGGKSVWSSFSATVDTQKPILLVQAGYDSNSFFHDLAIGANANTAGAIAVLLAADALSKVNRTAFENEVVFALYTGEAWGYLGSKRFAEDIKTETFTNFTLADIGAIIEVNQIGFFENSNNGLKVFVHRERGSTLQESVYDTVLNTQVNGLSVLQANSDTPGVPPSSVMAFLERRSDIDHVVITNHGGPYINKYYQSMFDDAKNINSSHLCLAANLLVNSIYRTVMPGNTDSPISVNCTLALLLQDCLVNNLTCDLSLSKYLYNYDLDSQPSNYVSVWRKNAILTPATVFMRNFLAELTAFSTSNTNCSSDSDCDWNGACIGSVCTYSPTYYYNALSLAFDLQKDKTSFWDTESTWMESNWGGINLQIYRVDNPTTEIVTLVAGIVSVVASFGVVWFMRGFLTKRFKST